MGQDYKIGEKGEKLRQAHNSQFHSSYVECICIRKEYKLHIFALFFHTSYRYLFYFFEKFTGDFEYRKKETSERLNNALKKGNEVPWEFSHASPSNAPICGCLLYL